MKTSTALAAISINTGFAVAKLTPIAAREINKAAVSIGEGVAVGVATAAFTAGIVGGIVLAEKAGNAASYAGSAIYNGAAYAGNAVSDGFTWLFGSPKSSGALDARVELPDGSTFKARFVDDKLIGYFPEEMPLAA